MRRDLLDLEFDYFHICLSLGLKRLFCVISSPNNYKIIRLRSEVIESSEIINKWKLDGEAAQVHIIALK